MTGNDFPRTIHAPFRAQGAQLKPELISPLKFWFWVELSLEQLAQALCDAGVVRNVEFDMENEFEWFTSGTGIATVGLNVSRRHNDGATDPGARVVVLVTSRSGEFPAAESVRSVAIQLGRTLNVAIHVGSIKYLGGSDFQYDLLEVLAKS